MDVNSFSKAVKEFQEIYKKEFKEEINEEKASEKARKLLNLFKVIFASEKQYGRDRENN